MRHTYSFTHEPTGSAYQTLLAFASGICESGVLVVQPRLDLGDRARTFLERLAPQIRSREEAATEWPGTKLLSGVATVLYFVFSPEVKSQLSLAADGLYEWRQPELPEDLALLRADGQPFLGSIAHEKDAFLTVDAMEFTRLGEEAPALRSLLRLDPEE